MNRIFLVKPQAVIGKYISGQKKITTKTRKIESTKDYFSLRFFVIKLLSQTLSKTKSL